MSTETPYTPPQVVLDLSASHPSLALLLEEIAASHERGVNDVYLVQTANGTGKTTKFAALLAKIGKVVVLNCDELAIRQAYDHMTTIFEGGKMRPWVAMKKSDRHSRRGPPEVKGDLSKAAVIYMTADMLQRDGPAVSWDFETPSLGASILVLDDVHCADINMEKFIQCIPQLLLRMGRPLQIVIMSATLDVAGFERFFRGECKTRVYAGYPPF